MEEKEITITLERYTELIKKEFVYDFKKQEVSKNGWSTETDRLLYGVSRKEEVDEQF